MKQEIQEMIAYFITLIGAIILGCLTIVICHWMNFSADTALIIAYLSAYLLMLIAFFLPKIKRQIIQEIKKENQKMVIRIKTGGE